jgi:hypothetical protein
MKYSTRPSPRRTIASTGWLALILVLAWSAGVAVVLPLIGEPISFEWFLLGLAVVPWVALSEHLPNKDHFDHRPAHSA